MKKQVRISFQRTEDYKLLPVHGAWGGVTPHGDIVADLYVERVLPPDEVVLEVEENKAREVEKAGGESHVRETAVGLLMKPEAAHALGRWLIAKAEQAGVRAVQKPGDQGQSGPAGPGTEPRH